MPNQKKLPNVLLIQVDQMAAPALPFHGNKIAKAPQISTLAASGVVFDCAYCNFPICAPSRYSMLSGRLPSAIEAFDNATEFPASIPTLAHYLLAMGYSTTLCGKMHFVGPDQLHGFEERLITDIYPADFSWTPNWLEGPTNKPTGMSMRPVVEAGKCTRSMQMDYDEEVEHFGIQKLFDLARYQREKPFFLTISFTHPHPPFTAPAEYWDLYRHDEIDMPKVPAIPIEQLDEYSRWLYYSHGRDLYTVTDEHIRNARHGYYGMISYIDDKVGRVLSTLDKVGLRESTLVVFVSDHGEMLGERGMWYKQTFYEWSARVPFVISFPGRFPHRRVASIVSLVDLLPTILDVVTDGKPPNAIDRWDGKSLMNLLFASDAGWPDVAVSEYSDIGVCAPCRMLRRGRYKYLYTHGHAGQLYNLWDDPDELINLVAKPEFREVEQQMLGELLRGWDPENVLHRVLQSQKRRLFLQSAVAQSRKYPNWSYQIRRGDEARFVRGGGPVEGTANTKSKARFPYVDPVPPDPVKS